MSNAEINRDIIGNEQRRLLSQWFGIGPEGAAMAKNSPPPADLDLSTLKAYHEIARRVIQAADDFQGTQRARMELIEQALEAQGV